MYALRDTVSGDYLGISGYSNDDNLICYYLTRTFTTIWATTSKTDAEYIVNNEISSFGTMAMPENDNHFGHLEIVDLGLI